MNAGPAGLGGCTACKRSHRVLVWDLREAPRGPCVALTGVCGPGGGELGPGPEGGVAQGG